MAATVQETTPPVVDEPTALLRGKNIEVAMREHFGIHISRDDTYYPFFLKLLQEKTVHHTLHTPDAVDKARLRKMQRGVMGLDPVPVDLDDNSRNEKQFLVDIAATPEGKMVDMINVRATMPALNMDSAERQRYAFNFAASDVHRFYVENSDLHLRTDQNIMTNTHFDHCTVSGVLDDSQHHFFTASHTTFTRTPSSERRSSMHNGWINEGRFADCIFDGFDFTDCDLDDCRFTNCIFKNCKLTNSTLRECKFIGCTFAENVDFARAAFTDACTFENCALTDIRNMNRAAFDHGVIIDEKCTAPDGSVAKAMLNKIHQRQGREALEHSDAPAIPIPIAERRERLRGRPSDTTGNTTVQAPATRLGTAEIVTPNFGKGRGRGSTGGDGGNPKSGA